MLVAFQSSDHLSRAQQGDNAETRGMGSLCAQPHHRGSSLSTSGAAVAGETLLLCLPSAPPRAVPARADKPFLPAGLFAAVSRTVSAHWVLPGTVTPSVVTLRSCGLAKANISNWFCTGQLNQRCSLPVGSLSSEGAEFGHCRQAATHTGGVKPYYACQSLQLKSLLHFLCNHFGDGKGGGSSRRRGISDVKNPASDIPTASIKHKVIYQIPVAVECLSSHSGRAPATQRRCSPGERKCFFKSENPFCSDLVRGNSQADCGAKAQPGFWGSTGKFNTCESEWEMSQSLQ